MPTFALRVLLCDKADFQGELSDKFLIICIEEDVQQILDNSSSVVRASDHEKQIEGHDADEEIIFTEALKDSSFMALDNLQIVLRHQI